MNQFPLLGKTFVVFFNKERVSELLRSNKCYKGEIPFLKELMETEGKYEYQLEQPEFTGRYKNAKFMTLSRQTRQYLLQDEYIDVDIVASQPNIMLSFFKSHNMDCPKLKKYCENRDKYIQKVIDGFELKDSIVEEKEYTTKDKAKELFTSIMNLGKIENWAKKFDVDLDNCEYQYFKDLRDEINNNLWASTPIEKELFEYIKSQNKERPLASFSSALYQQYERKILEMVLKDDEVIYGIYAFDGAMFHKDATDDFEIFEKMFSQAIKAQFGEHFENVRMIVKPMTEAWKIDVETLPSLIPISWKDLQERNHAKYAKLYVENNPRDYIYSQGCWYKYNEFNRIQQLDTKHPHCLKNKIYEFFRNITMDLTKSIPPNDENLKDKLKLSSEIIKFVGTDKDLNGIISLAITHYKDDDLYFKLDTNTNLLAFENRVYDYSIKSFRDIEREDFIMKNCRYNINETKNEIIRKKIEDELLNIFDIPIIKQFWLQHIALALFTNKYEVFYCHTGKGGNGKGLLFNFLKASFGDYYYQTGTEFLTTRIEDGKANPTLANAKGVRFLVCSEPDTEKTKVRVDFVKAITGNDEINCRDLYSSNKYTYKPTYTTFLQCNDIPDFSKIDGGIRRRFKKFDYPNQFVDKPILKNEKQKDENLKALFSQQEYINEFVLLLIDTTEKTDKLVIPKEIEISSKSFLDEQDKVYSWLEEYTKKDDTSKISKADAYNYFLTQMNEKKSEFSAIKFHKQMEKNNIEEKKIKGNRYYSGISFIKVIEEQECKFEDDL